MDIWEGLSLETTMFPGVIGHGLSNEWDELDNIISTLIPVQTQDKDIKIPNQVTLFKKSKKTKSRHRSALARWRYKRTRLNFKKKRTIHMGRSKYAINRPRVDGRFITLTKTQKILWDTLIAKGLTASAASKKIKHLCIKHH